MPNYLDNAMKGFQLGDTSNQNTGEGSFFSTLGSPSSSTYSSDIMKINAPSDTGNVNVDTNQAGSFWSGAGSVLQGVGGLAQGYAGLKALDLGKEQLAWGKHTYADNYNAQRDTTNEALFSQNVARAINDQGMNRADAEAYAQNYVDKHGVGESRAVQQLA